VTRLAKEGPFRRVMRLEYYQADSCPSGGSTVAVKLSCGHTIYRKGSKAPRVRARCWRCGYNAKDLRSSRPSRSTGQPPDPQAPPSGRP